MFPSSVKIIGRVPLFHKSNFRNFNVPLFLKISFASLKYLPKMPETMFRKTPGKALNTSFMYVAQNHGVSSTIVQIQHVDRKRQVRLP